MAWARKLPSARWQGCYRDEAGETCTVGTFARKKDAVDAADAERAKKKRDEWIDPELARTTVGAVAATWLEGARHTLKPKTVASYQSLLSSRVVPTFGKRELRAVKPSDVTAWVGAMVTGGLSASRIRQAHVVLRLVLDSAVRDGFVARNPAVGIKLPRLEHREAAYFAPDVVEKISETLGEPYGVLVAVLGTVGLRWGEAAALRGRHVDRLRRRLIVEDSLAEIAGHLVFGTTKSHARRRVPLPTSLLTRIPIVPADALVFTAPKGGALHYRDFLGRVWHPALAELELPKCGLHVLRHSAAARIVAAGGSPKTLQTVLGHRSAAFSLTVYARISSTPTWMH
jgi:integrase